MGIEAYNKECRGIVMRYAKEWEVSEGSVHVLLSISKSVCAEVFQVGWTSSFCLIMCINLSSPTQLLVQLLPGTACETLNSLLRASSTQQQLSQQWVNNIIPILNPEHSTVTAVKKKINSIPAKPGTFVARFPHLLTCCASTAGVFAVLGSPSTRSFGWWMDFLILFLNLWMYVCILDDK